MFSIESNFIVFYNRNFYNRTLYYRKMKSEKNSVITIIFEFFGGLKKQSQIVFLTISILEFICITLQVTL